MLKKIVMPTQVSRLISILQNKYMKDGQKFRNQWAALKDVEFFSIVQEEITGERSHNVWGKILHGRFGACLKCNNNYVGLWSCNVTICRDEDKETLVKIFQDIDSSLLPKHYDDEISLIQRISRSKYLDDIVIYNPSYSILNESLTSHQPKRRSEGVVKKMFMYTMDLMEKEKDKK